MDNPEMVARRPPGPWRRRGDVLHVQQQMLALPRADDGHEFHVLLLLDGAVDVDEALAQQPAQAVVLAQQAQRLRQAGRQFESSACALPVVAGVGSSRSAMPR